MNTIHFRDDDGPSQMFYENKSTEGNYDEMPKGGLPLFNLVDPNTTARIERRKHRRFQIKEVAFALIRYSPAEPIRVLNRGMGEIACAVFKSKPIKLGRIDDISKGGLAFCHVDSNAQSSETLVLDILLATCGFYLGNLAFKTIADIEIAEDFPIDTVKMRQLRLQFRELTSNQKYRLEYLIRNYSSCDEKLPI
jgi:hypothetical protein